MTTSLNNLECAGLTALSCFAALGKAASSRRTPNKTQLLHFLAEYLANVRGKIRTLAGIPVSFQ
jgi:hypothetical protein